MRYRIIIEVESDELDEYELDSNISTCINRGFIFGDAKVDDWKVRIEEAEEE